MERLLAIHSLMKTVTGAEALLLARPGVELEQLPCARIAVGKNRTNDLRDCW